MTRCIWPVLAALSLTASLQADFVPFSRVESFNGSSGTVGDLPAAAGDVVLTFSAWTFRDGGQYGGGPCFGRSFSAEGDFLTQIDCPQWSGCDWISGSVTVEAGLFNAWRENGVDFAMGWKNASCGLAWNVRLDYLIEGVDRLEAFVGDAGVSFSLPPAIGPVTVEFRSTTFRPYDQYGGSPCFTRTLFLEGGGSITIGCPGFGCGESSATLQLDSMTFNESIQDGLDLSMSWQSAECGLSWSVRYTYESLPDCNENSRSDEIDLAIGVSPDCNGDGVPDECQGIERVERVSRANSPFGAGLPASVTFDALPPALAIVELAFEASADLDSSAEAVIPVLDGIQYPALFTTDGQPCSATSRATLLLLPEEFADLAGDGSLSVQAIATAPVNPFECSETSISVRLSYVALTAAADCDDDGRIDLCSKSGIGPDCNLNGIGDLCDIRSGFDFDCDADGLADSCRILDDPESDKNLNLVLDSCEVARGDLDLDGEVGPSDLAVLLSLWGLSGEYVPNLDGDGLVGPGDLSILLANWQSTVSLPCGNGVINALEDCENCPEDFSCPPDRQCVFGVCVPCPPPPYGGYCGGIASRPAEFVDYYHQPDGGLDPNFRHFARVPVPMMSGLACLAGLVLIVRRRVS